MKVMEPPGWFQPDLQGQIVAPLYDREQRAFAASYIHFITRQAIWALRTASPMLFDGNRDLRVFNQEGEHVFRIPQPEQIFDFIRLALTGRVFPNGYAEVCAEVWIPSLTKDYREVYRLVFTTSCRLPVEPAEYDEE
jgi:hypothetical protein